MRKEGTLVVAQEDIIDEDGTVVARAGDIGTVLACDPADYLIPVGWPSGHMASCDPEGEIAPRVYLRVVPPVVPTPSPFAA